MSGPGREGGGFPSRCAAAQPRARESTCAGRCSRELASAPTTHVHDDGPKFDLHLGAELQVWRLILGGTLGHDSYGKADGAPISALTTAVHLGATAPLFGWQHHGRLREIRARAALELGLHSYSPSGRESDVQLELVGRRDRDPVRLAYTVESCGGLLRDDDE